MSNYAVITQSLSKKFNQNTALNDCCIEVQQGDIYALVGCPGSGKTTLLNILAGTVRASSGSGRIFNHRLGSQEARKIIGYVPAKPAFYSSLTVLDYLVYMGMLAGISKLEAVRRSVLLLKEIDLYSFRDKKPVDLTPGMKTKISIAQSFLPEPQLILMDEPVSGLDETGKENILQIIKELSLDNCATVVFSAPLWTDIESIADRISVLDKGKVLLSLETADLRNLYGYGVFLLHTTDNQMLLNILQRVFYLKQIIQAEDDLIIVLTKERERFRKDLPTIIHNLKIGLYSFREEEVTVQTISRYLLPGKEEG